MSRSPDIENIVTREMARRFPKVNIIGVMVEETIDDDGDPTLSINVILEAKKEDFDPAEVPSFLSEVTPQIMAHKKDPFPIFSFISKADWGNRKTAAA